jgi:hypothetical protein
VKLEMVQQIQDWYSLNKANTLKGRYLPLTEIEPLLKKLKFPFQVSNIGTSFNKLPIRKVSIGTGEMKVLIWSQMHGNESTGTKAVFDLFNFLKSPNEFSLLQDRMLENCTLTFIPILNPDGALAYTRVNAQEIDLNRDAVDLKAPESKVLHNVLREFKPDYCFNLHDQRTIFTVGKTTKPATLSFLAPSEDETRAITDGRKETMNVIVAMNEVLQKLIPGQIGRYTDEYYPTATGDNFQKAGYNTILIEAGHFKDDYDREHVRFYNFLSLLIGIDYLANGNREIDKHSVYFKIPNNSKKYFDVICKNIFIKEKDKMTDVGVLFKEILDKNRVVFNPEIKKVGNLTKYAANKVVDCQGEIVNNETELGNFVKKLL